MNRPARLSAICGTGTEVGKTWVTARVAELLTGSGVRVAARKPVQSFDPDTAEPTDADVLARSTHDAPTLVCPTHRWYPVPMAPPMAAARLGWPSPELAQLLDELRWPDDVDLGVVETVGGVRSPIAEDGDSRDLVQRLDVDHVVVVADAGLGVIDATRGAVEPFPAVPTTVLLNRFDETDDLHRRNREWLIDRDGLDVVTDPRELADRLRTGP